ncbi:hypothetical protein CFOL_v3_12047, partial [Cephalotus follicularis]
CDERIQKIQTIKLMEGIFICAAPHCLKSFLKRTEFESHIHESHADLLQPNAEKEDGNESEMSAKQSNAAESTLRAPTKPGFSPSSNSQLYDRDDKARRQQPPNRSIMQPRPPFLGQAQNFPAEPQLDNSRPPGFDRPGPPNSFQRSFDSLQQESNQFSDKQQGFLSENPFPEYPPLHSLQPPNFVVPMNPNPVLAPPFGLAPFPTEGAQPFYGAPYEVARQDSAPDVGSEPGSLLGFPPGSAGAMNFAASYPQPWITGSAGSSNNMDHREGKGVLAPQPMQFPQPPPPPPPHLSQLKRGKYYSGDMGRDGQGYGWQHENRDGFGSSQD